MILTLGGHGFPQVHQGIKGMVLDENSNNLTGAVISVTGINHDVTSGRRGPVGKPERPAIEDTERRVRAGYGSRKDALHQAAKIRIRRFFTC